MSTAVMTVKIRRADKKGIINERNEVEREIMTFLSKRSSLTKDKSTIEQKITSKIGYLAENEGTENILKGSIPQTLQCDIKTKKVLKC